MKPKTLILMVVAVVCGLGASYMTSRLLAERDDKPAEAPVVEKVTLLVAKKNIEMHTALRGKPEFFFQDKQFIKEDAPKDALTVDDWAKLKNKFLKRGLRKGDHIVPEDLMDNTLSLRSLPNGMRAIGIRVNVEQIAGGFASLPGSHVDIMWTTRRGNDKDTFTKVLLEDVIVLAADTNTSNPEGGAMVASVVTVALHPDDAMKLTLAMDMGSLRLIVRNLEDKSGSDKERISMDDLLKDRKTAKNAIDPLPAPPEVPEIPAPEPPKIAEPPPPQPKLTKMTVTVRNGPDVRLHHYWVDEDRHIVPPPQETPPPHPANSSKKDNKKIEL